MSTPSGKKRKLGKDGTSISRTPNYKTPKKANQVNDSKRLTRSEHKEREMKNEELQKELETKTLRNGKQRSPHPHGVVNQTVFGSVHNNNYQCTNNNNYQCNFENDNRVSDSPIEDDDLDPPSEDDDSDSSFDKDDPDGKKKASQEKKAKKQKEKKKTQQQQQEEKVRKVEEEQRKVEEKKQKRECLEKALRSTKQLRRTGFCSESPEAFLEGAKFSLKKLTDAYYLNDNGRTSQLLEHTFGKAKRGS